MQVTGNPNKFYPDKIQSILMSLTHLHRSKKNLNFLYSFHYSENVIYQFCANLSIYFISFQYSTACKIFRNTNNSYPLLLARMCVYQGVRNISFSENFECCRTLGSTEINRDIGTKLVT